MEQHLDWSPEGWNQSYGTPLLSPAHFGGGSWGEEVPKPTGQEWHLRLCRHCSAPWASKKPWILFHSSWINLKVVESQLRYQSLNKTTALDCSRNISLSDTSTVSPFLLLHFPSTPCSFLCCVCFGVRGGDREHTGNTQYCTRNLSGGYQSKKLFTCPQVTAR